MFYCTPCATERGWPEGWAKSRGSCELCGKTAICSDRPSSSLPLPAPRKKVFHPECGERCLGPHPDFCREMSDCTLMFTPIDEPRADATSL